MPLTSKHLGRFHDCFSKLDSLSVFNVIMEWLIDTKMSKRRLICLRSWDLPYIRPKAIFCQILNGSEMCKQYSQVFIWYHSPDSPMPISLYHHLFRCLSCLPIGKHLNTTPTIFHKTTFTIHYDQVRSFHFWRILLILAPIFLGWKGIIFWTVKILVINMIAQH